ncbi:tyrosine-type recombinase/integrase [Euzebya pacifica]|jgi:integrase|uniref:tyrosine-type recombinase/integrase n=1 Tax=Euzebya pacifica TaxID=1608957 RepID=UPI0030FA45FF
MRPVQEIQFFSIQKRDAGTRVKRPYIVRYAIDGRQRSRSFRSRVEADRYRSELVRAAGRGVQFDPETGEPASWKLPLGEMGVHQWVRRWLAEQWVEWQPRTRESAVDAMARFVIAARRPRVRTPDGMRRYLVGALAPDAHRDETRERWLARNCLTLDELDAEAANRIALALTLRVDGKTPLAANTANRYRTTAHACVMAAVDVGALPSDPWPRRSRSRSRRKVARVRTVDVRSLPTPAQMARALAALRTHQPASRRYQVMTSVVYYAGLRPSEVVMLRVGALTLPEDGWGSIHVVEAEDGEGGSGEPKTGPRHVPIPPPLVALLRDWLDEAGLQSRDELLFRTRTGQRPSRSNWRRAWLTALDKADLAPMRVYDCRHAAATTWLRAGVPLGETARRLGHSVETLVSVYVGALGDDEKLGNARIEAELRAGDA